MNAPLRVLVAHNAYQHRGGEDSVVDAEVSLLREAGHPVELYLRSNDDVEGLSRLELATGSLWSRRTIADIARLVEAFRPHVIHVHNTLPLISPSVYWAASRSGVPIVQTLHNFRLMCPQGLLLREEQVCEDCVGKVPWRAVRHRCYRQSAAASAVVAGTTYVHRLAGTYSERVTRYIALNEFCRKKFIEGGLPSERIRIKPNFIKGWPPSDASKRSGGLFVGRLSVEKGISVLIDALRSLHCSRFNVVGNGEFEALARDALGESVLGFKNLPEILELMTTSAYLVVPSIWYENFPRTIVEAYACGLPVIASRIGALSEIVIDGETGLLFDAGSAQDLAEKMRWAEAHPGEMEAMGRRARLLYEAEYTAEINYRKLVSIYEEAIASQHAQKS